MLWHQVLAGRLVGRIVSVLYGVQYTGMCAFRAIHRDAFARLDMQDNTFGWNIEMQLKAARAGLRILELPMPYRCRAGGTSATLCCGPRAELPPCGLVGRDGWPVW